MGKHNKQNHHSDGDYQPEYINVNKIATFQSHKDRVFISLPYTCGSSSVHGNHTHIHDQDHGHDHDHGHNHLHHVASGTNKKTKLSHIVGYKANTEHKQYHAHAHTPSPHRLWFLRDDTSEHNGNLWSSSSPFYSHSLSLPTVMITHGLGARNPAVKSHFNDKWVQYAAIPGVEKANFPYIAYTARGHGTSSGWETSALAHQKQFTWKNLAHDMYSLAQHLNTGPFVACGSSQGSATSLFTAMQYPQNVRAVIMIRPPTAWYLRKARRHNLISGARKLQAHDPNGIHHLVLHGAMKADLPDLESEKVKYDNIQCPVLILTVEGDAAHPVQSAIMLHAAIPNCKLFVAKTPVEAYEIFPGIIQDFLLSLN